jgi:uncharacterized membrane protein
VNLDAIPPALLMGVLLSAGYAAILHIWSGRSLAELIVYLVVAPLGFALGQLLGVLLQIPVLRLGQVHWVPATIMAWLALLGARELFNVLRTPGAPAQSKPTKPAVQKRRLRA